MRDVDHANAEATADLRGLIGSMSQAELGVDLGDGWTAAMALAHLAYWDAYHHARWRHAAANGREAPPATSDEVTARANEALETTWRALPVAAAASLCLSAAEAMDALALTLTDEQVATARAAGHPELVARSPHRQEHIAQIRLALGRG